MSRPLLQLLRRRVSGLTLSGIIRALGLPARDREGLLKRLRRLEEAGLIFRLQRRYFAADNVDIMEGTFHATSWGKGFVSPDRGGPFVHIPEEKAGGALHGDKVEVAAKSLGKRGRPEGQIVRVIAEGSPFVIGEYREDGKGAWLCPLNAVQSQIPLCTGGKGVKPGWLIEAERHSGRISGVIGDPEEMGTITEAVRRKYRLPAAFSGAEMEAASLPDTPAAEDLRDRRDLRGRPVFTMDCEGARDFDDAVDIEHRGGGYRIGVHIADVTHFVPPSSRLDREAFLRGTSVYFPDRVLPMLPERLSFGAASLIPGADRLALSLFLEMDSRGCLGNREFCLSVIRSRAGLSYSQAGEILARGGGRRGDGPDEVVHQVLLMREAARLLRSRRLQAGGLDFNLLEGDSASYQGDGLKKVSSEEREAGGIIEDFMIAANEAAARFLETGGGPVIYRIHPPSPPEAMSGLRGLLPLLGISFPSSGAVTSRDIQAVLDQGKDTAAEILITRSVLRSLRRASYSTVNKGHFGLGKKVYTHFTSPIRRYPDLMVHRMLKKRLRFETINQSGLKPEDALFLTERQRIAEEAEREALEWRVYRRLQKKVGQILPGLILETAKAGLVVVLEGEGQYADGFLPYSLYGETFIRIREHEVRGRKTGLVFRPGQKLMVSLRDVDALRRRLVLEPAPQKRRTGSH